MGKPPKGSKGPSTMAANLWDRIVGRNFDPADQQTFKIPVHQFQASLFEACSALGKPGGNGTTDEMTWTGKTVKRESIVADYNLSAEQDNATGGEIDLKYLVDVYKTSSDPVRAKVFLENVMMLAELKLEGYDDEAVARARLDLVAAN